MMQLKGFKKALKKLAKKRYHEVRHYITEYNDGDVKEVWEAYIENIGWTNGYITPEEAIAEMEIMIQQPKGE